MAGLELLLTVICINVTCNSSSDDNNVVNLNEIGAKDSNLEKASFLDEIRGSINGQQLRVVTLEDYPLSYTKIVNGTKIGMGVAFQILEFLTEKFNFTYELVPTEKNIVGSTNDMTGSLIRALIDKKADIAAAFVPLLADARHHIFYSTTSLDEGEWIMIMTRPAESASGSGLLAPFDRDVWFLILISLVVVGPCIYLLIIIRMKLTRDKEQKIFPLPHCIWFVYGALMKQGSTLSPIGDSTRLLFATWWIFITILTSFYTANLTAFLTLSKFTLPINNVDDILKKDKHFVAHRGGGVEYAIKNTDEALTQLNKMVERNLAIFTESLNDTDILINMVEKNNYVYVRDRPAIDHLIYSDYKFRKTISMTDEKVQCPFAISKTPFMKRKRAFAYPIDSKINWLFDPELLHLVESGIVKYMLLENLPKAEICPPNLSGTERQLRNGDLMMTYYVMITGFCTSTVVFVTEMIFKYLNNRGICWGKKNLASKTKPKVRREIPFIQSITPPPPYATLFNRSRNILMGKNLSSDYSSVREPIKQNINGREYYVVKGSDGGSRLIPLRVPSAALFQYSYTN